MSLNLTGFLGDVKRAAIEAVAASKPFAFVLGEVTSVVPLKIQIDQKLELTEAQLVLTNAVRDYCVTLTDSEYTEDSDHKYLVHLALKPGERVLLLRTDGGQKFIVLDRVEALT